MIELKDSQIAQITPDYFKEKTEVKCLSYALQKATQKLIKYCQSIGVFAMIDNASDEVLDLLAVELNTQYYDTSLDIQNKRDLIKGTLVWYQTSGTPSAVEELITAVFGEGKVEEWFEYGDSPYYFKIKTNAQLTPDIVARFRKIIERVKNARSHMRNIEIDREIDVTEKVAIGAFSEPEIPITNGYETASSISLGGHFAAVTISEPERTIIPVNPDREAQVNGTAKHGIAVTAMPIIPIVAGSE
ncbi:MAG: phage tail protein [Lachnospiraceae bacterium]|nr:phage tail protein [Lachnospiraceae bacterium]